MNPNILGVIGPGFLNQVPTSHTRTLTTTLPNCEQSTSGPKPRTSQPRRRQPSGKRCRIADSGADSAVAYLKEGVCFRGLVVE